MNRYEIIYEGYLFEGDSDGLNVHPVYNTDEALALIHAYGMDPDLSFMVRDLEYGVSWFRGEWS